MRASVGHGQAIVETRVYHSHTRRPSAAGYSDQTKHCRVATNMQLVAILGTNTWIFYILLYFFYNSSQRIGFNS